MKNVFLLIKMTNKIGGDKIAVICGEHDSYVIHFYIMILYLY